MLVIPSKIVYNQDTTKSMREGLFPVNGRYKTFRKHACQGQRNWPGDADHKIARRTKEMAAIKELLRTEADGTLSFGDYELSKKTKLADFNHQGDLYKVKTFQEITKLERNEMFVYESVPGTAVQHFQATDSGVTFQVEGPEDAQITLGLENDTEYVVQVDDADMGTMRTNLGGKLPLSVELGTKDAVSVKIVKA
jgi:hypothetical protein